MEFSVIYFTSAAFWTFILLAFGMGYLIANIFTRNKFRQELDKCQLEKSMLLNNVKDAEEEALEVRGVKAVQTRGRSGIPVRNATARKSAKNKPEFKIDFERIGTGDPRSADDLQRIEGIGPFIEKQLNEIGIYHFIQLSRFNDEDVKVLTAELDYFPGRIKRDKWVEQAINLYQQEMTAKEA